MSRADDDMDDEGLEGLGSFRSMFREMPDEEPPQRGLAELMAAARVKADEMAKPSLWERFLQTMRRPQVMALATIMILIGGAVFISQRKSEMDASPTASQEASLDETSAPARAVATGAAGSGMAFGAEEEKQKKSDGEDRVGGAADQGAAAPAPDPSLDRQSTDLLAKGQAARAGDAKEEASRTDAPARRFDAKAPPKAATSVKKSKPRAAGTSRGDLMEEGGLDDRDMGGLPGTGTMAGGGGGGTGASSGGKSGAASGAVDATPTGESAPEKPVAPATSVNKQQPQTVQQLHASARKLATSGDCAQVRTLAKQIAAKDPTYYRANIATDSSLAGCLK